MLTVSSEASVRLGSMKSVWLGSLKQVERDRQYNSRVPGGEEIAHFSILFNVGEPAILLWAFTI